MRYFFVDLLCVFFCLVLAMPLKASVYMCLWSPAGKRLTSWLSFVVSYCEFIIPPERSICGSLSKNRGICVLADFLTSSTSSLLLFCQ